MQNFTFSDNHQISRNYLIKFIFVVSVNIYMNVDFIFRPADINKNILCCLYRRRSCFIKSDENYEDNFLKENKVKQ